jgi:FAD binding domain
VRRQPAAVLGPRRRPGVAPRLGGHTGQTRQEQEGQVGVIRQPDAHDRAVRRTTAWVGRCERQPGAAADLPAEPLDQPAEHGLVERHPRRPPQRELPVVGPDSLWAQPGATTADVSAKVQPFGLALPTGDTESVGLGGLTLGGGMGFLVRKYGLTIDNLISVELVTADGRLIRTSADEHPDLFWALRGGGGNFGVATAFQYRLQPVGELVFGGGLILPASAEVLRGYVRVVDAAPDELSTIAFLLHAPPLPFIPADKVGSLVLMHLRSLGGGQGRLRPDQPVPPEPEHQATRSPLKGTHDDLHAPRHEPRQFIARHGAASRRRAGACR